MPKPKKEIIEEYERMVEFCCVVCHKLYGIKTPPCIHHFTGAGMGLKNREQFIPLCHTHHQGKEGIHHIGKFTWEEKFGTQEELLEYQKKEVE